LDELVARVSAPRPDSCQKVLALIRHVACRTALPTPFPGSRHGATRKVEIRSFLEHAYGVAQAGDSRVSPRKGPLRRIPGRFEMRVARPHLRFSTVENRVTSTLHRCERKRIVSKLLAPSNYRPPTLSETVRRCGHSPITVSQRSRICHINLHSHACKTSEGPKANRKQTARAVAPSLSHTLADSGRQPVQLLHRFSMVQNLSHRPPTPQHGCKHQPVQPHHRFSTVQNLSHRPPASTCVQASVWPDMWPDTEGRQTGRAVAPSLSHTLAVHWQSSLSEWPGSRPAVDGLTILLSGGDRDS
jgi:hypothetical protein